MEQTKINLLFKHPFRLNLWAIKIITITSNRARSKKIRFLRSEASIISLVLSRRFLFASIFKNNIQTVKLVTKIRVQW